MQDIHIADGHSAAGSLRHAIAAGWMHGEVFILNDVLAIGPLGSAAERLAFMLETFLPPSRTEEDEYTIDCIFEGWRDLQARCQVPGRVMLWTSGSASDHVLLRMACHFLRGTRASLWQVAVPTFEGGYEAVASHPPEALARFAPGAAPLSPGTVASLAADYRAIAARPEPLRQCDADGTLHHRPIDWHDAFVLACCPPVWTRANRVVGQVMSRCEPRHVLGDFFFAARLRALIQAGQIERRTPLPEGWWDWSIEVRRLDD